MAGEYWNYPTNYTNGTGVDSASDFFLGYPAYITSGLSSNIIVIAVFLGLLALALPFGMGTAVVTASFISFILTTYLWWNDILSMTYPIVFFVLSIGAAIVVGNTRN